MRDIAQFAKADGGTMFLSSEGWGGGNFRAEGWGGLTCHIEGDGG